MSYNEISTYISCRDILLNDIMLPNKKILVYDLKNLENFTACACTLKEQNDNRKEEKQRKNNPALRLNFADLN